MKNLKRYTMVIRRDKDGFATPALKIRQKGEVIKFSDVEEILKTSTNKAMFQLVDEMDGFLNKGVDGVFKHDIFHAVKRWRSQLKQ